MSEDSSETLASRVPRWRQIAATLAREIEADCLAPGTRLSTEAEFSARFGVNRHTIRRALDTLVRSGQVRVEQGKGAFVADDLLHYEISTRTRFSERIRRQNRVPDGHVLRLRPIEASAAAAAALDLPDRSPLILLERIGLADGVPISLTDHHFPVERLPGIADALRTTSTITAALRTSGVDDYIRRSTRVTARMPTASEADLLEAPRHRPLLVCENVNVDRDGRPIEFSLTRHPSSRVQLVFEP